MGFDVEIVLARPIWEKMKKTSVPMKLSECV